MKEVLDALQEVDAAIDRDNKERERDGLPPRRRALIQILGQMSLMLNEEVASRITLFATQDVDALITGDSIITQKFQEALEQRGLQFDFHSTDIWLPKDAKFLRLYEGSCIEAGILDPISALTSKALKAPEKNHALVREALKVYGEELSMKIRSNGGDPEKFSEKVKFRF